jgi:hypothetical protein
MVEVLDQSFHLSISEEVGWVVGNNSLCFVHSETVNNKSYFTSGVGGEDILGVNLGHFEAPVSDGDNSGFQVNDVNVVVLRFETINSLLGEVSLDVVVVVVDKEVWVGFLDETFEVLVSVLNFGEVSSVSDHIGVKVFKVGHF